MESASTKIKYLRQPVPNKLVVDDVDAEFMNGQILSVVRCRRSRNKIRYGAVTTQILGDLGVQQYFYQIQAIGQNTLENFSAMLILSRRAINREFYLMLLRNFEMYYNEMITYWSLVYVVQMERMTVEERPIEFTRYLAILRWLGTAIQRPESIKMELKSHAGIPALFLKNIRVPHWICQNIIYKVSVREGDAWYVYFTYRENVDLKVVVQ